MENVKRFFDWIIKKDLPPLSLKLTKQVIDKIVWLYAKVEVIQSKIQNIWQKLDFSRDYLENIKKCKALIDQNSSFK